ncbi:hypothetical protein AX14_008884 [Amanita brunnescens Koide BX004]|nr:hypothetical protein AX14_008884 [Amanita brunnescens Koide BX004]
MTSPSQVFNDGASSPQSKTTAADASPPEITVETAIEHARRAFALRKYEQAAEHYATALEMVTREHGDSAPEAADLYFSYGKALLENAIAQTSVLGNKEQPETEADEEPPVSGTSSNAPILSFSGDADEGDGEEDPAVDLLAHANKEIEDAERDAEEPCEDGEPEDDFNAAWEVLEMARSIYEGQKEDDDDVKLKLADTYVALGDVSLETEKFDQAINDYSQGLELKEELLPISSRHIAEVHYKLSMVLDLTSGRLSDAISHVEKALESVESRMALLRDGLSGQIPASEEQKPDIKGKGKATAKLARDDLQNMTKSQMESELRELNGLKDDLALKVEELKSSPNETLGLSAPELAARALDKELDAGASSAAPAVVTDLTSTVKKKKKIPPLEDSNSGKRKAEGDTETSPIEKKVKLDTPDS